MFCTIDPETLTRADLKIRYGTGHSVSKGYGRWDRTTVFVPGFLTKIGDIEESEWLRLAEALVARENGEEELQKYVDETEQHCPWLRTDAEIRQHALDLYMQH